MTSAPWVLVTVLAAVLALPPASGLGAPAPVSPQAARPSPSPSPDPEERAREAEREDLEMDEEEPPAPPAMAPPRPSPSPAVVPSPSPVPRPPPSPEPPPAVAPSPPPAPEQAAEPSLEPSPEPPPEPTEATPDPTPDPEQSSMNLIDKLPNFQDIDDIDLTTLLKVTAGEEGTRVPDDEPGVVTIVSEEDIRRTGARTLREVLQTVSGLEVLTDALGRARIVIRGVPGGMAAGSSENVLVLLNGVRLNDTVFGGATAVNLDLPIDNIKRVEVVRGPGSVVHGPGAVLGVINVVTETVDTFRRDELTLGGGSFGTFLYNFRYGTTVNEVSMAGFMQFLRTEGPGLAVPADAQTLRDQALAPLGVVPASLAPGVTEDDQRAVDANLSIAYRRLSVSARLKKETGGAYVGLLDTLGRQNRLDNRQASVDVEYRPALRTGDLRARVGYFESRATEIFEFLPPGYTTFVGGQRQFLPNGALYQRDLGSRRLGGQVVLERPLAARHSLTAGASLERRSTFDLQLRSNYDFVRQQPLPGFIPVPELVPDAERSLLALFAQDAWNPTPRLGITAGLRLDRYDDFGSHLQPRLAAALRPSRHLTLKASYGRAVRPPSFVELLYSSPATRANPDLEPVRSDSLDATALVRVRDFRLSATAYQTWLRDVIAPQFEEVPAGGPPSLLVNRGEIRARGLDLEASRAFSGMTSIALVYSLQRAEDDFTGARLAGVPTHLGRLSGNFGASRYLVVSPSVTFRGERPRSPRDPRPPLEAYALAEVAVRILNLHPALELSAVAHDLFDERPADPS
ncbi:MAG TPA: TonB-dependent receptor, partial [Vicinamibacteria bacterium]|nr:TonB-dependent receptor [Vicinamibacteria bacterium]